MSSVSVKNIQYFYNKHGSKHCNNSLFYFATNFAVNVPISREEIPFHATNRAAAVRTWINVFNSCSGLHKHGVSQKHSAFVATNSAGNCSEVSWKISGSFTLTNVETLSQTLVSFSAVVQPVTAPPPPPPPTVTLSSFTCNVLLIVNSTQPMTLLNRSVVCRKVKGELQSI